MADLHIDEFFTDAARAVVSLYGMFPRPVTLYAEDICGPDDPDEYGVHSPRYQSCFATLVWLGSEGYITFADTIGAEAIDQAVLSGQCFAALHTQAQCATVETDLPGSVAKHQGTLIFQLQSAVKSKSSEQIQTAFSELLSIISSRR